MFNKGRNCYSYHLSIYVNEKEIFSSAIKYYQLSVTCFSFQNHRKRVQTTGQKFNTFLKNVKIFEFHDHIWNQHKKCIQISTNMPGIGSIFREIAVKISEI